MAKKRITIKDIAKEAGVSIGTVDRVIHKRGEVAESTRKLIEMLTTKYEYKPNFLARALTTNSSFNIGVLIPQSEDVNGYWKGYEEGIRQRAFSLEVYSVRVTFFKFDINSAKDFARASRELVETYVDGAIIAPLYEKEAHKLIDNLESSNIQYVLIDTDITTSKALCFVGEDAYQSGRLAASVVDFGVPVTSDILMVNYVNGHDNQHHIVLRNEGFKSYFMDLGNNNGMCISVSVPEVNFEATKVRLDVVFKKCPNLGAIWVSGMNAYLVAQYLESINRRDIVVVGHDLYEPNFEYLKRNYIKFIIAQKSEEQGVKAMNVLFSYITEHKHPIRNDYQKVEIVNSENIRFYL